MQFLTRASGATMDADGFAAAVFRLPHPPSSLTRSVAAPGRVCGTPCDLNDDAVRPRHRDQALRDRKPKVSGDRQVPVLVEGPDLAKCGTLSAFNDVGCCRGRLERLGDQVPVYGRLGRSAFWKTKMVQQANVEVLICCLEYLQRCALGVLAGPRICKFRFADFETS